MSRDGLLFEADVGKRSRRKFQIAECGNTPQQVICKKALSLKADAANPEEVRQAVKKTVEVLGHLNILVNKAGALAIAPIEQFPMADFEKLVAVNVRGLFVATREASHHLPEGAELFTSGVRTVKGFHSREDLSTL